MSTHPLPQARMLPSEYHDSTMRGSLSLAKSLEKERATHTKDMSFTTYRDFDLRLLDKQKQWLSSATNAASVPIQSNYADDGDAIIAENGDKLVADLQNTDDLEAFATGTNRIQQFLHERKRKHDDAYKGFCDAIGVINNDVNAKMQNAIDLFKERLGQSDKDIAAELELLDDQNISELNSAGFDQLWERVASHTPVRLGYVHSLAYDFDHFEISRCKRCEKALKDAAIKLIDIGYLLQDDVERLIQGDAHAINMASVANKVGYAQLVACLKVEEAKREQKQRRYWESRRSAWRQLRHLRAISKFKEAITQDEFTFPIMWRQVLSDMKSKQQAYMDKIKDKVHSLLSIKPPYFNGKFANQWCESLDSIVSQEENAGRACLMSLSTEQGMIRKRYEALLQEVKQELISYGVMSAQETEVMITNDLQPMGKSILETATVFVEKVTRYLDHQSKKLRTIVVDLKKHVTETAALVDKNELAISDCRKQNQESLEQTKITFESHNQELETEFNHLLDMIRKGASPSVIDECLQKALSTLANIEDGYRKYQQTSVDIKSSLILALQSKLDQYDQTLLSYFRISRNPPPPSDRPQSPDDDGTLSASSSSRQSKGKKKDTGPDGKPMKSPNPNRSTTPERERHGAKSPGDKKDSRPSWVEEVNGFTSERGVRYSFLPPESENKPDQEEITVQVPKVDEKAAKKDKAPANKELKDVKKPEKRDSKATPEPTLPPPPPVEETEPPSEAELFPMPTDPTGVELLVAYAAPESDVSESQRHIRNALINDFEASSISVIEITKEKVKIFIDNSTKSLNDQLRRHRPRAGQLELDVHNIRLGELTSNKQKFERHAQSVVQLSERQQKDFDDMFTKNDKLFSEFKESMKQQAASLSNVDNTNSLQVLERSTAKIHYTFVEGLRERSEAIRKRAQEMQAVVVSNNNAFLKGWKTFDEGGSVNPDELESYRGRIDELEKRASIVCNERVTTADSLEAKQLQEATRILEKFKSEYTLHARDIQLLESLSMKYNAVQSKVRAEFISSDNSQKGIEGSIAELERLCQKDAKKGKNPLPHQILLLLDNLRRSIHSRSQYLSILKTPIELAPINLVEDTREQAGVTPATNTTAPTPFEDEGKKKKEDLSKKPADAAKKAPVGKSAPPPAQPPKGAKPADKKEATSKGDKKENQAVPSVVDNVSAIVNNSREEIMNLIGGFLQSNTKDSITRPNQIPGTVEEFMQKVDSQLEKHAIDAESHRKASAQELRGLVVRLSTLLLRTPNAVFRDIMSTSLKGAADSRSSVEAKYSLQAAAFEEQRIKNVMTLKPSFSHPQMRQQLDDVCRVEESRIDTALDAFQAHIKTLQDIEATWATAFLDKMVFYSSTQLQLLDTMVFLDDLYPGEQPLATKRKTLKQLIRANELKQVAATASTGLGSGQTGSSGTGAYPQRTWAGLPLGELNIPQIPGFGPSTIPEEPLQPIAASTTLAPPANTGGKGKGTQNKEAKKVVAEQPPSREDAARPRHAPSQTSNDTPAHRAVVSLRDQIYAQFRVTFDAQQTALRERWENGLQKENRWRNDWRVSVQNLRGMATEPLAAPTLTSSPSQIPTSVSQAVLSTARPTSGRPTSRLAQ